MNDRLEPARKTGTMRPRGGSPFRAFALVAATLVLPAALARASSLSFTGTFQHDDNARFFTFTVNATATVTLRTWSYAGGTNAAGSAIPAGGLDPAFSVFDSTGTLIQVNNDGTCGQVSPDPVTGACFDSYISQSFTAGTYTLVLTESDNLAFGPTLADGFSQTGQGDFTCSEFGVGSGAFCDINLAQRTANWAVDIDNVDAASLQAATLTAQASAAVSVGGSISDTATLSGGAAPTGTIVFTLYGPNDATCAAAPIFTSTVPVAGNGSYPSAPFTANQAGTYRWIAAYSGDLNNTPAATACGDPLQAVQVSTPVVPTLSNAMLAVLGAALGAIGWLLSRRAA